MLKQLLSNKIQFLDEVESWEEAIIIAANPLLNEGYVEQRYIDAMINSVHTNGPYFILVPGIAMPHATSEMGALKNGLSLLKLRKHVEFPDKKLVNTLIVLSSENGESHMDMFSELANVLIDEDKRELLIQSDSIEQILDIL